MDNINIILKLLEWPFLCFIVLILFVVFFRKQLQGVLNRGDITITWGSKSIQLKELSDNFDEELDPIREDIKQIKAQISLLENKKGVVEQVNYLLKKDDSSEEVQERKKSALQKMKDALLDGEFRWRSIERLASIAAITENEAVDFLRSDREVIFSVGKSGRQIARLKSR